MQVWTMPSQKNLKGRSLHGGSGGTLEKREIHTSMARKHGKQIVERTKDAAWYGSIHFQKPVESSEWLLFGKRNCSGFLRIVLFMLK